MKQIDSRNSSTVICRCGASFTWEGFNDKLGEWKDAHKVCEPIDEYSIDQSSPPSREAIDYINKTPALRSFLSDINHLPETTTGHERVVMMCVVYGWLACEQAQKQAGT